MQIKNTNHSEMVDLAKPARLRHVVIVILCAPFVLVIGPVAFIISTGDEGSDLTALAGLIFLGGMPVLMFSRGLHSLFARPLFRANQTEIDLRVWGGGWWFFLPYNRIRSYRIEWSEIQNLRTDTTSYNGIASPMSVVIECANREPIHINGGVFNLSLNDLSNLIQSRLASIESQDSHPSNHSRPYEKRLERHFTNPVLLRYTPNFLVLTGLVLGPIFVVSGFQWLYNHLGGQPALDIAIAAGACAAAAWTIFAIYEAIRSLRYRNKKFWLQRDGIAMGPHESIAALHRWSEVMGARRRLTNLVNDDGSPRASKPEGLDILLRDGGTITIPEEFSNDLDELCDILTPNDAEAVITATLE